MLWNLKARDLETEKKRVSISIVKSCNEYELTKNALEQ